MNATLEKKVRRAKELAQAGEADDAAQLADELIAEHPGEMQLWLLRGYLNERVGNHAAAADNLTRAIELTSLEPHLFFTRGRYRFQLCDDVGAVEVRESVAAAQVEGIVAVVEEAQAALLVSGV